MSESKRHKRWSVLFDTVDGMTHPVRFSYVEDVSMERVKEASDRYLKQNADWLKSVQDIYPTAIQPSESLTTP